MPGATDFELLASNAVRQPLARGMSQQRVDPSQPPFCRSRSCVLDQWMPTIPAFPVTQKRSHTDEMYFDQMPLYDITPMVPNPASFGSEDDLWTASSDYSTSQTYTRQLFGLDQTASPTAKLAWSDLSPTEWPATYYDAGTWSSSGSVSIWPRESHDNSNLVLMVSPTSFDTPIGLDSPFSPPPPAGSFQLKDTNHIEMHQDDSDGMANASVRSRLDDFALRRRRMAMVTFERDNPVVELDDMERDEITGRYQLVRRPLLKKHKCSYELSNGKTCPLRFVRIEHLRRHMRVHEGVRSFKCRIPQCLKAFSRRDNYHDHYWTHVKRPGRGGRNQKMSIAAIGEIVKDRRIVEKLERKLKTELEEPQ
ncbi:hypothetical protein BDV95DRAFT_599834 [Massariosphaeria phaeospora]|uniref:C2H2 type master regulator of conidiophore development brlA n=1 Tax=Massariosphaeria phaeospora TaxID=100035 RepID=A0A7C8M0T3_9PLEO|nr:hypothetical protein BDV95DRAFT_599834 [Massariosphaeria phaeospora]